MNGGKAAAGFVAGGGAQALPERAGERTIHLMARVERKTVSRRTEEGPAAAKERRARLGNPMGAEASGADMAAKRALA